MKPFRFLTIPTSHYCEKARWALDLKSVAYAEEMYMPVFHIAAVKKAGGGETVPVFVVENQVFADSTDILAYLEEAYPQPKLFPPDPLLRQEVERLEELFDEKLGKNARRLVYSVLLKRKDLFFGMFPKQCPRHQVWMLRFLFPLFRVLVRRAYKVNAEGISRSLGRVQEVFAEVESLLEDGRPFLIGNQFTAADLTFACMAVPIALPENYFIPLPRFEDFDTEQKDLLAPLYHSKAAKFARKMFADHRHQGEHQIEI